MESNWRYNVPRLGMSESGLAKLARILTMPGEYYLGQSSVNRRVSVVYKVAVPGQLPVPVTTPTIHPANERFPWSEVVEPD